MMHSNSEPRDVYTARATAQARTDLTNAILTGADLRGGDLRDVRGLTHAQLLTARIDASTQLPLLLRIALAVQRFTRWWRTAR